METEKKTTLKDILNKPIELPSISKKKKPSKKKIHELKPVMNKTVLSFDIGTKYIKAAEGRVTRDGIKIKRLMKTETPENCIDDGNITDKIALSNAVKSMMKENNVKVKDVIFVTNSTSIINREVLIPKVENEDLSTLVRYEIQKFLPINMMDYTLQYYDMCGIKEDENKGTIFAVIYPNKLSKKYYDFAIESGLNPVSLDVSFNSISKLMNYSIPNDMAETVVAAIDIGYEEMYMNIYCDKELKFTRIIRNALKSIDEALSEAYGISLKETEDMREKMRDLTAETMDDEKGRFNSIFKEAMEGWISEMSKIMEFYKNKNNGKGVKKIYIYGGASSLKGLDRYLGRKFGIDVENLTRLPKVMADDSKAEEMNMYLDAIGGILRY